MAATALAPRNALWKMKKDALETASTVTTLTATATLIATASTPRNAPKTAWTATATPPRKNIQNTTSAHKKDALRNASWKMKDTPNTLLLTTSTATTASTATAALTATDAPKMGKSNKMQKKKEDK